jgi:hypothetical protein
MIRPCLNHMSTLDWLRNNLVMSSTTESINRVNRVWVPVAGFSSCGSVFAIYKDTHSYCVHAGDDWTESQEPLLGYYSLDLTWDDLLVQVAQRYDEIRNHSNPNPNPKT